MLFAALLLSSVPVMPAGSTFVCTPERVYDGDGPIWCREGPRVRLAGVAAREMDETCQTNQPCPDVSGKDARDMLVAILGGARGVAPEGHILVSGPSLTCISDGGAGGTRTAAWCVLPDNRSLNCSLVKRGTVLVWPRYLRGRQCVGDYVR